MDFDLKTRIFKLKFLANPDIERPTEIYVPNFQYPNGYNVLTSNMNLKQDANKQIVEIYAQFKGEIIVNITKIE